MKGKQNEYVLMQFEMGTPKKLPPIAGVASYMFASSTQKKCLHQIINNSSVAGW
jgi:hypothetical protein